MDHHDQDTSSEDVMMLTEWRVCIMVLVCSTGSLHVFADCPAACECKWKGGKETVICQGKSLASIPDQIDAGTQVLDLSDNLFEDTARDLFQQLGLINLQKIYLNKNKIKTLDRYTFRKLFNLVELDLSYNLLQFVPSHIFDSILELRELKLSGNAIHKITHEAFTNVPKLMRLEVSDCRITIVESRAFSGLESSLEWLKIDRNKIVNIRPVTFTSLHSLKGIELYGNPWNCSCYLRPLREWLLRTNIPVGVPPVCKYPSHMTGKSWERLNLEDFACSPNIRSVTPDVTAEENENVTLSCRATGSPLPKIKWMFKEKMIANISAGLASTNKRQYVIRNVNSLSNLTIFTATMSDSGIYTCKAKNGAGEVHTNISLNVIKVETAIAQPDPVYLVATLTTVVTIVLTACFVVLCIILLKARRKKIATNRRYLEEKCDSNHQQSKPLTLSKLERAPPPTSVAPSLPPARTEYSKVPLSDNARKTDAKEASDMENNIEKDSNVYYNCNIGDVALGHHVLRKEVLPAGGGSLYTTASPGYPDLLENYTGSNPNQSTTDFMPSTKNSSNYPKVSDSQSPLLPSSRYGSSGGESSGESHRGLLPSRPDDYSARQMPYYRFPNQGRSNSTTSVNTLYSSSQPTSNYYSMANGKSYHNSLRRPKYRYENSLPTSPNRTETPLLNLLSDTRSYSPPLSLSLCSPSSVAPSATEPHVWSPLTRSKRAFQYHNSQLDMYLQEYKTLQHELTRMKRTCDSLTTSKTSNPKSILKKHNAANVEFSLPAPSVDSAAREVRELDANYYGLPRKPFRRRLSAGDFYEN